jgi:hypothetical protein
LSDGPRGAKARCRRGSSTFAPVQKLLERGGQPVEVLPHRSRVCVVMPVPPRERERMLAVRISGPRVIARLESIGVTSLDDLIGRDPRERVREVNIAAGRAI